MGMNTKQMMIAAGLALALYLMLRPGKAAAAQVGSIGYVMNQQNWKTLPDYIGAQIPGAIMM